MEKRTNIINKVLTSIYGRKVPALYWKNANDMLISYIAESNSFSIEDGYEEILPLKTEDITKQSMLDFLDNFEDNVISYYFEKYGIKLILP